MSTCYGCRKKFNKFNILGIFRASIVIAGTVRWMHNGIFKDCVGEYYKQQPFPIDRYQV